MIGNFSDVSQQRDFRNLRLSTIPRFNAPLEQRGTASVTYLFNEGQSVPLEMFSVISATVPEPNMLWPTVIGIVGIATLARLHASRVTDITTLA